MQKSSIFSLILVNLKEIILAATQMKILQQFYKILQQLYSRTNYLSDFNMLPSDDIKELHNSHCMNMYSNEFLNLMWIKYV